MDLLVISDKPSSATAHLVLDGADVVEESIEVCPEGFASGDSIPPKANRMLKALECSKAVVFDIGKECSVKNIIAWMRVTGLQRYSSLVSAVVVRDGDADKSDAESETMSFLLDEIYEQCSYDEEPDSEEEPRGKPVLA